MKLPNAQIAVIEPKKLSEYLLNTQHKRGGSKARLLYHFGYRAVDWERLASDIRQSHLEADLQATTQTAYGVRYEIHAPLHTPSGRMLMVRTIWQIDTDKYIPRLITLYPD